MPYRRLSQFTAVSLVAITAWALVSNLGSVQSATDVVVVGLIFLAVCGVGAMLFLVLRSATSGSEIYWRTVDAKAQVARILTMIICALFVQMALGAYFDQQGRLGETSTAVWLVVWLLFLALFLGAKIIQWPSRVQRPSLVRLFLVGAVALVIAATLSSLGFSAASSEAPIQQMGQWPLILAGVVVGAALEEVVWRVLLLTALLQAIESRFQAVFLAGVGFAMMHAPLALMQPVLRADWPMLHFAVANYAPEFLAQAFGGCFLGAVWLRTGSISLVVLTHALVNVGHSLVFGNS